MIEIVDIHGISFTNDEIATIATEEDAVEEIRRLFARMLNKKLSEVVLTPRVREQVVTAWRTKRQHVQ